MPTTNGSRMSFRSQRTSRKTAAAPNQKRQRLAGTGSVITRAPRFATSPRLQPPLIGVLVQPQASLGQGALQLIGAAVVLEMQLGTIGFQRAHDHTLDGRYRSQPL